MLSQSQVEWIVRAKSQRGLRNEEIADVQRVSVSRVQQLYREYRRSGVVPTLKKAGRPKSPDLTGEERELVKRAFTKFRMCACYLEPVILFHCGASISHRRIHWVLREEGLALSEPRKQRRRK